MRYGVVLTGAVGTERTLNRMQKIALGLICDALDGHINDASQQHLQYIGGGGGTGKSWLIDTLRDVFAAKGRQERPLQASGGRPSTPLLDLHSEMSTERPSSP
jgi:hypothetical protein